jgi:hypothetical protein
VSEHALKISIPCAACSNDVRFGERVCSSCGGVVSRTVLKALDQRLEAASPDFRRLRSNVGTASLILLVVAGAHLFLGLLMYVFSTDPALGPPSAVELTAARVELLSNLVVAVAMVGCFAWARSAPTPALTIALVVWLAVQIATILLGGLLVFAMRIFIAKIITLGLLLRGIVSAVSAARLRAKLAPPRPAGLPGARVVSRR